MERPSQKNLAVIDSLVHDSDRGKPHLLAKARLFISVLLFTIILMVIVAVGNVFFFPTELYFLLGTAAFMVINLPLLMVYERYGRRNLLGLIWFACATAFIVFLDVPTTGGAYSPDFMWLYLVAVCTMMMTDARTAFYCLVLLVAANLAQPIFGKAEIGGLPSVWYFAFNAVMCGVAYFYLAYLLERANRRSAEDVAILSTHTDSLEESRDLSGAINQGLLAAMLPDESQLAYAFRRHRLIRSEGAAAQGRFLYVRRREAGVFFGLVAPEGPAASLPLLASIALTLLDAVVDGRPLADPNGVMDFMRRRLAGRLLPPTPDVALGMGLSLLSLDSSSNTIRAACMGQAAWRVRTGVVEELCPDSEALGPNTQSTETLPALEHSLLPGDCLVVAAADPAARASLRRLLDGAETHDFDALAESIQAQLSQAPASYMALVAKV